MDTINHARAGIAVAVRTLSDIILMAGSCQIPMRVSETELPLSTVQIRVDHQHEVKAQTPIKGLAVPVSDTITIIMPGQELKDQIAMHA